VVGRSPGLESLVVPVIQGELSPSQIPSPSSNPLQSRCVSGIKFVDWWQNSSMGVDFTACGDHYLEPGSGCDPELFVRHPDIRLAAEWTGELLREFNPAYRDDEPRWELGLDGLRCLRLPGTFRLSFGRHLFVLNHIARWRAFLTDPAARSVLRRATSAVVGVLGSSGIYYLPDSGFAPSVASDRIYDGGTLEDLQGDLTRSCGWPPTLDLEVMYFEYFDGEALEKGYFYEALPAKPASANT
jgi:hypothetical protein